MAYQVNSKKEKPIKKVGEGSYKVNVKKVKSDDPLAYSYGYIQGKEGEKISDAKNLAPAYIEGYKKGKSEREKVYGNPEETIQTAGGIAYYVRTDIEDKNGRWEGDNLYTKDGYYEIHEGNIHHIYKTRPEIEEPYEVQTAKTSTQSLQYLQDKNVNVARHNWSFEVADNNKLRLTLGNMSDAGWYWNGDETQLVGYTYRLHQSEIENEFYSEMNKNQISFNQLKPLYLQSAKNTDGLYEISGDNRRWHFGETGVDDYYILEDEGLTEKQKEQFYEEYSPMSYEQFEEKHGKEYREDVKQAIKSSGSFREFNIKMDELKEKYSDLANEEDTNNAYSIIGQIKTEQSGTNLAKYKKIK